MVVSIALRLGLFLDDDEANVPDQKIQHGGRSPASADDRFSDNSVQEGKDSWRKRKVSASDQDEHEEDTGPPSTFSKVDGNYDGQPVDSDIIFRPPEKNTQRWNVQDVVSDYTLKYFNSALDEQNFKKISKNIGNPDN